MGDNGVDALVQNVERSVTPWSDFLLVSCSRHSGLIPAMCSYLIIISRQLLVRRMLPV